jgi:hypothetical protein
MRASLILLLAGCITALLAGCSRSAVSMAVARQTHGERLLSEFISDYIALSEPWAEKFSQNHRAVTVNGTEVEGWLWEPLTSEESSEAVYWIRQALRERGVRRLRTLRLRNRDTGAEYGVIPLRPLLFGYVGDSYTLAHGVKMRVPKGWIGDDPRAEGIDPETAAVWPVLPSEWILIRRNNEELNVEVYEDAASLDRSHLPRVPDWGLPPTIPDDAPVRTFAWNGAEVNARVGGRFDYWRHVVEIVTYAEDGSAIRLTAGLQTPPTAVRDSMDAEQMARGVLEVFDVTIGK